MIITPFEGDRFLFAEVARLCATYGVKTIFETGTQYGSTTRALAMMAEKVVTVEKASFSVFGLPPNVLALNMDSAEALRMVVPTIQRPALFYLDAHWDGQTPLLEELKVLCDFNIYECPIVIHDFQVPNKDFGHDTYGDKALNLEFIAEAIDPLMKIGYVVSFNANAEGCRRGACFLTPAIK